jgi:hypothetical protein
MAEIKREWWVGFKKVKSPSKEVHDTTNLKEGHPNEEFHEHSTVLVVPCSFLRAT